MEDCCTCVGTKVKSGSPLSKNLYLGKGVSDGTFLTKGCPYYRTWTNMLKRCYGANAKHKKSPYDDCTVCDDWLTFSTFKGWMETQDWEGKELDKDLLGNGKLYSPETCVFIITKTNRFLSRSNKESSGAYFDKSRDKWSSFCSNPFTGKDEFLGRFFDREEAHQKYLDRKLELAHLIADTENDERVKQAVVVKYEST